MPDREPTESERRAAAELGLPETEMVRIMDTWEKHAMDVSRERLEARR